MCLLLSKNLLKKTRHVSVNVVTILRGCIYSSFYSYYTRHMYASSIRGLLEKYPTFGREKETGLLGALDT